MKELMVLDAVESGVCPGEMLMQGTDLPAGEAAPSGW